MIIDAFMYFNEQDVAEIRLNELKHVVDETVIIRSDTTFSGRYNSNKFVIPEEFKGKVKVIQTDFWNASTAWERERITRDSLIDYLRYSYDPDDSIIFTDVDEIPHWKAAYMASRTASPVSLNLDHYNYNFRYLKPHWECGVIAPLKDIRSADIRDFRGNSIVVGGWHLSYFGDAQHIQEKLRAYSHTEFDTPAYTDLDRIENRIQNNIDIIDRPSVRIEQRFSLPQYVLDNKERFKYYL